MKKHSIVLVEDEKDLADLTARFLEKYEFECCVEYEGLKAIDRILRDQPELVILDLMLPDLDGMEVCKRISAQYRGKIVMLTARTDVIDQVVGLELGADDYIPKPVEPRLLLARIRAVLRRDEKTPPAPVAEESPSSSDYRVRCDTGARRVTKNDIEVELSNPEFDVFSLLYERRGEVISRDQLFQQLRGIEYDGQNRQVDILVSHLRSKLEADPNNPQLIKTVRGKGYLYTG